MKVEAPHYRAIIQTNQLGPFVLLDDKMIFYDFMYDRTVRAKDLPVGTLCDVWLRYHLSFALNPNESAKDWQMISADSLDSLTTQFDALRSRRLSEPDSVRRGLQNIFSAIEVARDYVPQFVLKK